MHWRVIRIFYHNLILTFETSQALIHNTLHRKVFCSANVAYSVLDPHEPVLALNIAKAAQAVVAIPKPIKLYFAVVTPVLV